MLNQEKKYRILVVDNDKEFLRRITSIINKIVENYKRITVIPVNEADVDDLKDMKVDIAFLDEKGLSDDNLLQKLHFSNPSCYIVLLISNAGGKRIEKVISTFENFGGMFSGAHLLKDNYSDVILHLFSKKFLSNVIPELRLKTNE